MNQCSSCTSFLARVHRRKKRNGDIARFAIRLKQTSDILRAAGLCSEMISRFGSVEAFAGEWRSLILEAQQKPKHVKFAADSFLAILRLIAVCSKEGLQLGLDVEEPRHDRRLNDED